MATKSVKAAKKTIPAKVAKKVEETFEVTNTPQTDAKKFKFSKGHYIFIGILVLVVALYFSRGLFIAAMINGQPIFRTTIIKELERQGGKRVLESMVVKTLILQEAQKQQVKVDQKEVDSEINKIKDTLSKQGQNFDQALAMQGLTKDDLVEQIKIQKLIEKMVGKDITVTDKEISDFIEQNKEAFPEGTKEEEMKNQAKEQVRQRKLSEKVQTWIADLQQKAKVSYFINY